MQVPLPDAAPRDILTELLRTGARRMLATAIEAEVTDWIASRQDLLDEDGHRLVVRNGHQPPRTIQNGIGPIEISKPRMHDRRPPGRSRRATGIDPRTVNSRGRIKARPSQNPDYVSRGAGAFSSAWCDITTPGTVLGRKVVMHHLPVSGSRTGGHPVSLRCGSPQPRHQGPAQAAASRRSVRLGTRPRSTHH